MKVRLAIGKHLGDSRHRRGTQVANTKRRERGQAPSVAREFAAVMIEELDAAGVEAKRRYGRPTELAKRDDRRRAGHDAGVWRDWSSDTLLDVRRWTFHE
jgi:hypothetical protein